MTTGFIEAAPISIHSVLLFGKGLRSVSIARATQARTAHFNDSNRVTWIKGNVICGATLPDFPLSLQ